MKYYLFFFIKLIVSKIKNMFIFNNIKYNKRLIYSCLFTSNIYNL